MNRFNNLKALALSHCNLKLNGFFAFKNKALDVFARSIALTRRFALSAVTSFRRLVKAMEPTKV